MENVDEHVNYYLCNLETICLNINNQNVAYFKVFIINLEIIITLLSFKKTILKSNLNLFGKILKKL